MKKILEPFSRIISLWSNPLWAFCFSLLVYFAISGIKGSPFRLTDVAYYNYLADAFLHGQYHLRIIPPSTHDLVFFNGMYFLYWPPVPAILFMPLVAIFGIHISDVFVTVIIAAANVALMALLLNSVSITKLINLDQFAVGALTIFFAFGTVHFVLAPFGEVWFTGQLVGFFFVLLAYIVAIRASGTMAFLLTGTAIGLAMLTRGNLVFTGIWPAYYLLSKNWSQKKTTLLTNTVVALIPPLVLGLWFLSYNYSRFGSWLNVGLPYHEMAPIFLANFKKYGAFNLYYVPVNFYYQYIYYPLPFNAQTYMGGSLFLLSPVFFLVFPVIFKEFSDWNIKFLLLSIILTSIPIFLLMGTGWVQFGPRYTLDFTVPLMLLTAYGIKYIPKRYLMVLIGISIIQYLVGVDIFLNIA